MMHVELAAAASHAWRSEHESAAPSGYPSFLSRTGACFRFVAFAWNCQPKLCRAVRHWMFVLMVEGLQMCEMWEERGGGM